MIIHDRQSHSRQIAITITFLGRGCSKKVFEIANLTQYRPQVMGIVTDHRKRDPQRAIRKIELFRSELEIQKDLARTNSHIYNPEVQFILEYLGKKSNRKLIYIDRKNIRERTTII